MVLTSRGLRPIGHLHRADGAGHLPRIGRAPTGPLAPRLAAHARALLDASDGAVSVILRGSLARGGHAPADIDLMLVLRGDAGAIPDLPSLPGLPLPVEIAVIREDTLLRAPRGAWPRFALAHCGWTLAGTDLLSALPPPRLGPAAIAHLRGLRRWWPASPLDWAASLAERRLICGWLAKRILRSLAEGEMVRRGLYSRDIWPCLQVAARAWPAARPGLTRIAGQAIAPDGRPETLRDMTATAAPLLERAARRHLERSLTLPIIRLG